MRSKMFFYAFLFFLLTSISELSAQGVMDFTNYPGSTSTSGMGEEGAALRNSQDAFSFNPANLSFSNNLRLSLYHNPYQFIGSSPLNNLTAAFKFKGIGTFGLQYLRQDFNAFGMATPENPDNGREKIPFYDYALSFGYAAEVTDGLSLGLSLKYGKQTQANLYLSSLLFSAGLNYQPEVFNRRINLGFSLMNMGNPVKYKIDESMKKYYDIKPGDYILEYESPVYSKLHLALSAKPLETDYIVTTVQLGFSRYLIAKYEGKEAKSSFSAIFNDWEDFPRDAVLHTGLSFEWKPLNLGKGFSFYQNYYLGTISSGPLSGYIYNYYTHGAEIGIGYKEFIFSAGYSGKWHNVQGYRFISPEKPWETFQFSLEWDINKHFNPGAEVKAPASLKNILISFASGYNFRKGHLITHALDKYFKSRNGISYTFEAAFYMNSTNALIAALYYTPMPLVFEYPLAWGGSISDKNTLETFGIYSAYRYHPLEVLPAMYVQGGLGIERLNPVNNSRPKYSYYTSLNMAAGANLDLFNNNVIITPELNYQMMFVPLLENSSVPRLGGENQIAISLKAGYRF